MFSNSDLSEYSIISLSRKVDEVNDKVKSMEQRLQMNIRSDILGMYK